MARPWKMEDQTKLAKFVYSLADEGISSVSSNSYHDAIPKLYPRSKLVIVEANRNVNSDGGGRGKVPEYLILTGKLFEEQSL